MSSYIKKGTVSVIIYTVNMYIYNIYIYIYNMYNIYIYILICIIICTDMYYIIRFERLH